MASLPPKNQSNDPTLDDQTCEAVGCFANASDVIFVKVGKLGELTIPLCKKCISEFEDH